MSDDITQHALDAIPKPNRVMAPIMWYGGKGNMVKKLMPLLPEGKVYVEPYCGAGRSAGAQGRSWRTRRGLRWCG